MHIVRVGVLMGGKSIEREVSFNSGRTVCDHLDTARYSIIPLFQTHTGSLYILPWHFLHRGKIADFEHRLEREARHIVWDDVKTLVDFVYIATHGKYAEDGTLQGFLEVLGIPYLGSGILTSAIRMNKTVQKYFLRDYGVDTPRGITVTPAMIAHFDQHKAKIFAALAAQGVTLPYIVKPQDEGSSLGVTAVFNEQDLYQALLHACHIDPHREQPVLIEEKLQGMEFSCISLVDNHTGEFMPLPPTEIVPEHGTHVFDYDQKYMPGRATKFTPPRCDEATIQRIHDACRKTMAALSMRTMSRIDGFVTTDGRVVIIDPNTLSGMGPASFLFREAAEINMSHTAVINHLIETDLIRCGMLTASHITHAKDVSTMQQQKKLRVAVLMGGNSNEREVSLESGRNVVYKLSPHHYDVIPVFVNDAMELFKLHQSQLVRNSTKEIAALVTTEHQIRWHDLPAIADFVFIGLHGGNGENGAVQGTLEMLGMPYNGSSILTSALCMDKYRTNQFLANRGFAVPKHTFVTRDMWTHDCVAVIDQIITTIGLPVIVKPHDDGCSVMVHKASTTAELTHAIETLLVSNKSGAFVEECIVGMELTVGVIGNETPRALPPSQAVAARGILSIEEKFLPGAGENQTPAPLSAEQTTLVQRTMEDVYAAVGCSGYARIDCFLQTAHQSPTGVERVVVLEINTLPGLTPATCIFHQAAEVGIKPMDFIDCIVRLGLEKHRTKSQQPSDNVKHHTTKDDYVERQS